MSETIKVFKLNDCDWWAGSDLEAVKAEYLAQTGVDEDEGFDEPYDGLQDSSVRRRMARLIRERAVGEKGRA